MQLDVEVAGYDQGEQHYMNIVHYTMRYLLGDGTTMSPESVDISIGVLSGVIINAYGLPKVSALHMMSILMQHIGQPAFAAQYVKMTKDAAEKVEFEEKIGIEYQ